VRSRKRKAKNNGDAFPLLFFALHQKVRSCISVIKPGCTAFCAAWFYYAQNKAFKGLWAVRGL